MSTWSRSPERQSGYLKNELEKLEQSIADQHYKFNDIYNMIVNANERMNLLRLETNWNQEQLEQC